MMDPGMGGARRNNRRRRGSGRGTAATAAASTDQRNAQPGARRRKRRRRTKGNGANGTARDHLASLEPVVGDHSSVLGSRVIQKPRRAEPEGPPDAFNLFSAYHLGVTIDDGYSKPSLNSTAHRFGISADEVKSLLQEYAIDLDAIAATDFDLEGARLDVRLAPEGISRLEIARDQFEELQSCKNGE